jgi:poly(A) polymerase
MLNWKKECPPNENHVVWEQSPRDLMPMITPAFPATNSAYNVSEHSLDVMKAEFQRGYDIVESIVCDNPSNNWDKLFEYSDFFLKYNHYLRVNITGTGDNAISRSWTSFGESRVRHITKDLSDFNPVKQVHLYPGRSVSLATGSVCYFVGFNIDKARVKSEEVRIDSSLQRFK